jgi:hypothetical protein
MRLRPDDETIHRRLLAILADASCASGVPVGAAEGRRMTRRGKRRVVGLAVLIVVAIVGTELGWRIFDAPWSFGGAGRPTLTGTWEGPRRAKLGAEYRLLVELDHSWGTEVYGMPDNLEGEARLCSPTGDVWVYRLTGRANRAGDAMTLRFGTPTDGPRMPTPGQVDASWDGDDTLTIAPGYNPLLPDGRFAPSRVVSSADPDDSFLPAPLTRGDRGSFERACRLLKRLAP